jgi:hypothetical protein
MEGKTVVFACEVAAGGDLVFGLHAVADDEDDVLGDGGVFLRVTRRRCRGDKDKSAQEAQKRSESRFHSFPGMVMSTEEGFRTLNLRPRCLPRGAHYSTKRNEKKASGLRHRASGFVKKRAGSLPQTVDSSR